MNETEINKPSLNILYQDLKYVGHCASPKGICKNSYFPNMVVKALMRLIAGLTSTSQIQTSKIFDISQLSKHFKYLMYIHESDCA